MLLVKLQVTVDMHEFVRTQANFVLRFSLILSWSCKGCNMKFYNNCLEVRRAETTERQWQQVWSSLLHVYRD